RLDRAKREVLRLGACTAERVEERALPDVRQTDDAAGKTHGRRPLAHELRAVERAGVRARDPLPRRVIYPPAGIAPAQHARSARMDMSFSPEHVAFRQEVREGIRSAMPPQIRAKADVDGNFEMNEIMEWHRILYAKGWVAPHWPKQYGGPGWDATRRFIFTEEHELSGAPGLSPFGLSMVGPLIMQF